jgi:hypothetical protein
MEDEKKLISLKEAATLSGYSADYIGQLIRAGKIPGKQVYTNITWMTTAEAVIQYKKKSKSEIYNKSTLKEKISSRKRLIAMEFDIIRLFFQTFRSALPILVVLLISFLLLVTSVIYISFSKNSNFNQTNKNINLEQKSITF